MDKKCATCWLGNEGKGGIEIHHLDEIADNGYPRHTSPIQFYICCDSRRESCPYALYINAETDELSFTQTLCLYGLRQKKNS